MSFGDPSELFHQIRTGYRRPFLWFWYVLAIAGVVGTDFGRPLDSPVLLAILALSGYSLMVAGFGLLGFERFREYVLYRDYSLRGHRLFLLVMGAAGLMIGFGATAMLLAR